MHQLQELADEAGLSLIHLALGFVLAHPAVSSAIIGPRTLEQLESQLGVEKVVLTPDVLDRIDEIVPPGTTLNEADRGYAPPDLVEARPAPPLTGCRHSRDGGGVVQWRTVVPGGLMGDRSTLDYPFHFQSEHSSIHRVSTDVTSAPAGPMAPAARSLGPDLARGVMLLAIALANSHYFLEGPSYVGGSPAGRRRGRPCGRRAPCHLVTVGPSRCSALLFLAYGVAQIVRRQEGATPKAVRRLLWRRSRFLIVLGFLHAVLLFVGDILTAYGVLLSARRLGRSGGATGGSCWLLPPVLPRDRAPGEGLAGRRHRRPARSHQCCRQTPRARCWSTGPSPSLP